MFKKKKDKKKLYEEFQLEDEIIVSSPNTAKPLSKDEELKVTASDIARAINKKDKTSKHKKQEPKIEEVVEIEGIENQETQTSKVEPTEKEFKEDTTKEINPEEVNDILARSIILQDIPEDDENEELEVGLQNKEEQEEEREVIKETVINKEQKVAEIEDISNEIVDEASKIVSFYWYDNDEYKPTKADIKLKKRLDKIVEDADRKSKKGKKVKQEHVEETKASDENNISPKDLRSFFSEGEEFKRKPNRKEKKKLKKENKKQKRRSRKGREEEAIKDQKIFKFRKKKYNKVEDFISYLNDHYLDIDQVATEVLKDKNFFGWISKRSGVFDESLREFQEIKAKTEKE